MGNTFSPQSVCPDAGMVRLLRPHLHRLRDAGTERVRFHGESTENTESRRSVTLHQRPILHRPAAAVICRPVQSCAVILPV